MWKKIGVGVLAALGIWLVITMISRDAGAAIGNMLSNALQIVLPALVAGVGMIVGALFQAVAVAWTAFVGSANTPMNYPGYPTPQYPIADIIGMVVCVFVIIVLARYAIRYMARS